MANETIPVKENAEATPVTPAEETPATPETPKPLNPSPSDLPPEAEPAMEETMEVPEDMREQPPEGATAEQPEEAGNSELAEQVAPTDTLPPPEDGMDNILEQLRDDDKHRVDEPASDSDIDLETNQILVGPRDRDSLVEMFAKLLPTREAYNEARKDPNSILSRAQAAADHGWGTTSGKDLEEVLKPIEDKLHIQSDNEKFPGLRDGHPSRIKHGNIDVVGKEAVLAIKARLGGLVRVNLLNSGFWVAIRSPQLDELQEIFATIDFENREIGRILGGHFALVTDLYLKRKFVDIMIQKRLIIESNFSDINKPGEFLRNIAFHDYDTLMHAVVMLMSRGGLRYRCICPKCGTTSTENLDISACKYVNEDLWTPEVRDWWNTTKDANGKLLKRSAKSLMEYRTKILNRSKIYDQYVDNGFGEKVKIKLEFREPTMARFFDVGDRLIKNLNQTIDNISNGDTDKAEMVKASLAVHSYQLIAPWIESLQLMKNDDEVEIRTTDPVAILSHLDGASKNDDAMMKTLVEFIGQSRFNYIGTTSIHCPKCGARPSSDMKNFYPLEIQTIFFGLLSRLWLAGR